MRGPSLPEREWSRVTEYTPGTRPHQQRRPGQRETENHVLQDWMLTSETVGWRIPQMCLSGNSGQLPGNWWHSDSLLKIPQHVREGFTSISYLLSGNLCLLDQSRTVVHLYIWMIAFQQNLFHFTALDNIVLFLVTANSKKTWPWIYLQRACNAWV